MGTARVTRLAALGAVVVAVAAWAQPSAVLPSGHARLAIRQHSLPSNQLYFEGAIQVVHISRAGASSGEQHLPLTLRVRRGWYRIWSATRPCDANCSMLDPPTDACSAKIQVPATVVVTTRVGHRCTIRAARK